MQRPGFRAPSLFTGINAVSISGPQDPFLCPKDIIRDATRDPKGNIVSWNRASYFVALTSLTFENSKKNRQLSYLRARLRVLWSDNPVLGADRDAVYMIQGTSEYFLEDMAKLLCGFANMPVSQLSEQMCEAAISPSQPLTQIRAVARADVSNKKTKKDVDFFQIAWSPVGVSWNPDGSVAAFHEVENRTLG